MFEAATKYIMYQYILTRYMWRRERPAMPRQRLRPAEAGAAPARPRAWFVAAAFAASAITPAGPAQDQDRNELQATLLGLVKPPVVVPAERARRDCLALEKNPLDYDIIAPHGDTLLSAGCRVVEFGGAAKAALPWTVGRYERTSVFTAEDESRGADARDTVKEEEVVLFELRGARVQAVWHARFETGSHAVLASITPEVAAIADGDVLLSVMSCVNGTGGCAQEFLYRDAGRQWWPVKQTWLDELPRGYSSRIRHGVRIDPLALRGKAGFYGDADANCCPSEELVVELSLRRNALVLSKPPVVRRLP